MDTSDTPSDQNQQNTPPGNSSSIPDLSTLMGDQPVDASLSDLSSNPPVSSSDSSSSNKAKKGIPKGAVIALALFFVISLPIIGWYVNLRNQQIADIRTSAYPFGCVCNNSGFSSECSEKGLVNFSNQQAGTFCISGFACCSSSVAEPTNTPLPACPGGSSCYLNSASSCQPPNVKVGNCTTSSGALGSCCAAPTPIPGVNCPSGTQCFLRSANACQGAGNTGINCITSVGGNLGSCCVLPTPTSIPTCPLGSQCLTSGSFDCSVSTRVVGSCVLSIGVPGRCCTPAPACNSGDSVCLNHNDGYPCGSTGIGEQKYCKVTGGGSCSCQSVGQCAPQPATLPPAGRTCRAQDGTTDDCLNAIDNAPCQGLDSCGAYSGTCQAITGDAGPGGSAYCTCSRGGGGSNPIRTPTPTPTGIAPTNPPGNPTNPPGNPTPTRTPTPTPTRTPTPTPTGPTNTPTVTNTPSSTPVIGECQNIKIYKDNGVIVPGPDTLFAGDNIVIAVVGTNATSAHIKINGEADWRVSTTTNTAGEWTFAYQIPTSGVTDFSITAELFISGIWQ